MKEDYTAERRFLFVDTLPQDIRYAVRMLRKSRGFTTVAVLTLALGVGANTAIFSAVNGILLKPLAYADPSHLVSISGYKMWKLAGGAQVRGTVALSSDTWESVQKQTPAIERVALCQRGDVTITGDAAPEIVRKVYVSSDFFPLMGVRPLLGRPILPGDTQASAKPVVVVSYALWRSRWGGDSGAIGRTVALDGKSYTLVGVMPPRFYSGFDQGPDGVWIPDVPQKGGAPKSTTVVARLKKGVSLAVVNAQLKTISPRFSRDFAVFGGGGYFQASALEKKFSDLDNALLILLGAVGFVLLIACVNVSGLLLSRSWGRRREVAIREALGASRWRIIRQFLAESILLALSGGLLGLLFSLWGVRILRSITPANAPEHDQFLLNTNVLWFTLAVSLLTGILFGLAPAMQASARRIGSALKEGVGESLAGFSSRRHHRLRSALVIVEVALAVILVIGATLVARSFDKLLSVKLGFRTDHIVTMTANFSKSICDPDNDHGFEACRLASQNALERIRATSSVQSAAVASSAPLGGWAVSLELRVEGQAQELSLDSGALIVHRSVSSDYFRTLGIRLLAGRGFTDADVNGSQGVAIVDETFAKEYLAGNPLGKRIDSDRHKNGPPQWMNIVGEVSDTHDANLNDKPLAEIFVPVGQGSYFQGTSFIARTAAEPTAIVPVLQQAIWSVDKNAPITDVKTMDQRVAESVAEPRFQAILLGSFGALGLILAMVGIYGVISYGVTQRAREIGIRMALGAQPANVLRMVIREGMLLAAVGITAGIAGALALGRVLKSMLFEIRPTDPATFIGVTVALALVAIAACYIPARRAMCVDPMVALRSE